VLITHEEHVAARASRVISFKDGEVIADHRQTRLAEAAS